MILYFIKRSDGQWVNKSYKRLADAKNKITKFARYYQFYRDATIYEIDIEKEARLVLTSTHEITTQTRTAYNGHEIEYERVKTTYHQVEDVESINNQEEDLSKI